MRGVIVRYARAQVGWGNYLFDLTLELVGDELPSAVCDQLSSVTHPRTMMPAATASDAFSNSAALIAERIAERWPCRRSVVEIKQQNTLWIVARVEVVP